jgi:hypothetical protein
MTTTHASSETIHYNQKQIKQNLTLKNSKFANYN